MVCACGLFVEMRMGFSTLSQGAWMPCAASNLKRHHVSPHCAQDLYPALGWRQDGSLASLQIPTFWEQLRCSHQSGRAALGMPTKNSNSNVAILPIQHDFKHSPRICIPPCTGGSLKMRPGFVSRPALATVSHSHASKLRAEIGRESRHLDVTV